MEKQFKPVPDVECLKYHGTPEKPDIKIFVSHRIDLDSETIDNPLYIPVRCGAVYDERENVEMLGDDTGDNISEKRMTFCELTVQYWAWKNIKADYYGLCHYRRYLSFSNIKFPADKSSMVHDKYITPYTISKYKFNPNVNDIVSYDAVINCDFDVMEYRGANSVYEYYKELDIFIYENDIRLLFSIIFEDFPQYTEISKQYMNGRRFRGYNCFILKKELFFDLCDFEFKILNKIERKLNYTDYSEFRRRAPAYLAEIIESIWIEKNIIGIRKYSENQLIMFDDTSKVNYLYPAFKLSNIPIVIPSSDYYAPYAAVCIYSIISHMTSNNNYDFIILSTDMSEQNKKILKTFEIDFSNVSIRFFNPEPLIYGLKSQLDINLAAKIISFYRIFMPYFLKNYDKVICIDCDLIFETDIANLFQIDCEQNYIAAARDVIVQGYVNGSCPKLKKYYKETYPLKDIHNYVDTGVSVYNLHALRYAYSFEETMTLSAKMIYCAQEQDVINLLCENHIKYISNSWNVIAMCQKWKWTMMYAPQNIQKVNQDSLKCPYVIHWKGEIKPWVTPNTDLADRFWSYARKSPFYEIILHRMMWDVRNFTSCYSTASHSKARKLADKILPIGSKRREFAKKILPKGSQLWNFLKKIYLFFFREK